MVTTNTPSTGGASSEELAEARKTAKIEREKRQQAEQKLAQLESEQLEIKEKLKRILQR